MVDGFFHHMRLIGHLMNGNSQGKARFRFGYDPVNFGSERNDVCV